MISEAERSRRDKAIALLRSFAFGKLTNDDFEEKFDSILDPRPMKKWEDRALWALKTITWHLYDDLSTHRLEGFHELSKEGKKIVARWILFLQTDRPYEWKRDDFISFQFPALNWLTFGWWDRRRTKIFEEIDWNIWPFRRAEDLEKAKLRSL